MIKKPEKSELYSSADGDFDRFDFHTEVYRVTAGHGGECFLITGSDKNALYDCGMAYCGPETVSNIENTIDGLAREGLLKNKGIDCIFLSHSHYDHIGGLPYIKSRYPEAVVYGSWKCQSILGRENARKLMKELGTTARNLYNPGSDRPVMTDGIAVDIVLEDGESVSLGNMNITAYETKGHTDCSLSYMLEPAGLLFTSESTGILESDNYVHTPCLKSFSDSLISADKCEQLDASFICLPHFGMLSDSLKKGYFEKFRQECYRKMDFVRSMKETGLSFDEMLDAYCDRYWTPQKETEQPYEAFQLNANHILKALLKAVD